MSLQITPCTWKHGRTWAYSVTYDEALEELFDHVVPLHDELGLPGHVEVVVGQMGQVRQIGQSSYNGYHHMGPARLRELIGRGWGVGNHSWTHGVVEENLDLELRQAKEVLEDAIGRRVVAYTAPGSNDNITPAIVDALQEHGYLCALSVTDDINRIDCDLWFLNRSSNLHKAWTPLFSAFDPFHRLAQAKASSGWVIDYCHCPAPQIPHESKDVYIDEHRARLEAVVEVGGDAVWPGTVEEITDYILCRRHVKVEATSAESDATATLRLENLPASVTGRQVTFDIQVPPALRRCPELVLNGQPYPALMVGADYARITLDLSQPVTISLRGSSQ